MPARRRSFGANPPPLCKLLAFPGPITPLVLRRLLQTRRPKRRDLVVSGSLRRKRFTGCAFLYHPCWPRHVVC